MLVTDYYIYVLFISIWTAWLSGRVGRPMTKGLADRIPLHTSHCHCVLGQHTTLPRVNGYECLVEVGGAVGVNWQLRLCQYAPRAAVATM